MAFSAILKRPSAIVEQIIKVIIAYIVAFTLFFFSQLALNIRHSYECHGLVAQWLEQRTHNPSVVGSIPTRPTMTIFDLIYLFYIAITESLFVQITAIVIFYVAAYFAKNPRHNWYYDEDQSDA